MNRARHRPFLTGRPHGVRFRALSLIETLAALVFLTLIACACARLLVEGGAGRRTDPPASAGAGYADGSAELIADLLIARPSDFGLRSVDDLDTTPTALTPNSALEERLPPGLFAADGGLVHLWENSSAMPDNATAPRATASRQRRSFRWLIVRVGDDIAVRGLAARPGSPE